MNHTLTISLSLNTISSYNTAGVDSIKFQFPLDSVDFSREGNSLVISSNDGSGSQALLHNYFVENEANTLPTFELLDGTIVDSVNFLTDYEIDTAAGPSESTNGLNSYSDDAGELISGIDKLGILGRDSFLSANDNVSIETSSPVSSTSNGNGNDNGGGDNGGDDNGGDDPLRDIDERFVFQPTSQITSEVTIKVTNPSDEEITVNSYDKTYIKSYEVKADGSIFVELTDAGKDALAKGDKLIFDIKVSVGGEERGVEVIINSPKDFTTSDADKASGIDEGSSIAYEHHKMHETYKDGHTIAGGTKQSDVTVITSGSDGVENSTITGNGHTTVDITSSGDGMSGIKAEENETNDLSKLASVTVKSETFGLYSEGTTRIHDVAGNVTIDSDDAGILTEGSGAEITIKEVSRSVKVTADGIGISTQEGKTTISDVGDVTVDGLIGIRTSEGGKTTIETVAGKVEITGREDKGINNENGEVNISTVGGDVTVTGSTTGISTVGYTDDTTATTITDVKGTVSITGTSETGLDNDNGEVNISTVGGDVTVTGGTTGISTVGYTDDDKTTTTITDVKGSVTITGTSGTGLDNNNGEVNISTVGGDVTVEGGKTGISTVGYNEDDKRTTTITDVAGKVKITGKEDKGIDNENGTVEISGIGDGVTIDGKWGGIYTVGSDAKTTISGVSGTVKSTSASNSGIYTQEGTTTIDGTGVITNVELTGGKVTGLDTKGGTAKISNVNNVTIKGNETGITSTRDDSSERIATTTIENVAGNVTIEGGTLEEGSEKLVTAGISTDTGSTTTIKTVAGDVNITAKNAFGGDSYGINNIKDGGTVEISDVKGGVSVKGGTAGINTSSDGTITINDVAGKVEVKGTSGAGIENSSSTVTISGIGKEDAQTDSNVTVKGGTAGINTSGSGITTIKDVTGKVTVTGDTTGIATSGKGATTTIGADAETAKGIVGDVTVSGGTTGIDTSGSGTTTIKGVDGNVAVNGNTEGIYTRWESTTTIEDVTGEVKITGTGSYGIHNQDGTVKISDVEKQVTVESANIGIFTSGSKATTTIEGVGDNVTVTGGSRGISTNGNNATTTIKDVKGNVTVTGGTVTGGTATGDTATGANTGIFTSGTNATTTIEEVTGNVTVTGSKQGIRSGAGTTTTIKDFSGDVEITATNTTDSSSVYGIYSQNGTVNISGLGKDGLVIGQNVTVKGGTAGIYTEGDNGKTTISDVADNVTVTGDTTGISTNGSGATTTIKGVGSNVTVKGGTTGIATSGTNAKTVIGDDAGTAKGIVGDVTVTGGTTGIAASGGTTTINDVTGDVKITGTSGAGIENTSSTVTISGIGKEGATTGGDVTITGGTTGIATSGTDAATTIEGVKGNVEIKGGSKESSTYSSKDSSGEESYGVFNDYGHVEISKVTGGNVTITGDDTGIQLNTAPQPVFLRNTDTYSDSSFIPEGSTIIHDVTGNVNISGTNQSGIKNYYGAVEISDVKKDGTDTGNVAVTGKTEGIYTREGETTIKEIAGNVTVTGGTTGISALYGATTIKDVTGDVNITGTEDKGIDNLGGTVEISGIGKEGATTGDTVTVTGGTTGIATSGTNAKTTIGADAETAKGIAGDVTVTGGTTGIATSDGGTTTISSVTGDVKVSGDTGISTKNTASTTATAITTTTINNVGDVTVTGGTTGISTESSKGKSATTTINTVGDVTVTGGTTGISTETSKGKSATTIEDVTGTVTVKGGETGIYTHNSGATTTISGVTDTVTVTGGTGIYTKGTGAKTTIKDFAGDVKIEGTSGVGIKNTGTVLISGAKEDGTVIGKNVTVTGSTTGISTSGSGGTKTTIESVTDNVTVEGNTTGISTSGTSVTTTIKGVGGTVSVKGNTTGIETEYGNTTIETVGGDVLIKGGTTGISLKNITHGTATTTIKNVTGNVIVEGETGISTSASASEGQVGDSEAKTTIEGVGGNVTVSGDTTGIATSGGGETTINNVKGNVTVTSNDYRKFAMSAEGKNSTNTISNVAGELHIEGLGYGIKTSDNATTNITNVDKALIKGEYSAIESDNNAHVNITDVKNLTIDGAVIAKDGSVNTISSSSAITVTITANTGNGEDRKGEALTATGGGQNIIEGHGTSGTPGSIKIVGGITADANSANIIKTVAGETIITLDGKIDVSDERIGLDIQKGEGWSKLVLTADSLDEFMDWYGGWLDKLAKNSDFANKIGVTGINIDLPDGMDAQSLEQWLTASGASGNKNVDDFYDLIEAFRAHDVEITYKGDPIPPRPDSTSLGDASTTLLTASVDDTHDSHSAAKAEEDQATAQAVAKADNDQTSAHSTALTDDSQATNHTVASLDDSQTTAHSTALPEDDQATVHSAILADASHIDAHVMELVDFTSIEDVHLSDADEIVQLVGGHYSHVLDMGGGDDTLSITDTDLTDATILMGEGNDHLSLAGGIVFDHTTIDGGDGYDVLELGNLDALHSSDGTLDLSSLAESISGFEVLDLSGASGTLHVDLDSLLGLGIDSADAVDYTLSTPAQSEDFDVHSLSADNTLVIKADSNESVSFDANWHDSGATVSDGGHEYSVYTTSYDESQYFILLQAGTMV